MIQRLHKSAAELDLIEELLNRPEHNKSDRQMRKRLERLRGALFGGTVAVLLMVAIKYLF